MPTTPVKSAPTLAAARLQVSENSYERIVAIFQPHRYSRTRRFLAEFGLCFANADLVVVTDIYSAGEPLNESITGQKVADEISHNHEQVLYHPCLKSLPNELGEILQPGDLALFLGAGNLNQIIPQVIADYCAGERNTD